ncbi:hypothetical protein [Burkholderia vietnamiensis]|uniref:hypothetical protein n=1 Tax=Burkholderia vietnamiensis TaxID=60552 RepID=UPI001B963193|nr:hypothetical protein [Burkholderia vietnamiensis]MBR8149133.1 hypothetical protein [Burkholderia vietnamiensis]
MTSDPANIPLPDALPNPRGGAVRAADAWLAAAAAAAVGHDDAAGPLSACLLYTSDAADDIALV